MSLCSNILAGTLLRFDRLMYLLEETRLPSFSSGANSEESVIEIRRWHGLCPFQSVHYETIGYDTRIVIVPLVKLTINMDQTSSTPIRVTHDNHFGSLGAVRVYGNVAIRHGIDRVRSRGGPVHSPENAFGILQCVFSRDYIPFFLRYLSSVVKVKQSLHQIRRLTRIRICFQHIYSFHGYSLYLLLSGKLFPHYCHCNIHNSSQTRLQFQLRAGCGCHFRAA